MSKITKLNTYGDMWDVKAPHREQERQLCNWLFHYGTIKKDFQDFIANGHNYRVTVFHIVSTEYVVVKCDGECIGISYKPFGSDEGYMDF